MFADQLNLYSLTIPIFMVMLGITIMIVWSIIRIPKYLYMYALCTITIGLSLLLYSILDPDVIPLATCLTSFFSFMSCVLFCYAVHLRLKLKMDWLLVLGLIAVAEIIIFYYSWVDENYIYRLIILGITPVLIFSHNIREIYKTALHCVLDRILRFSLIFLTVFTSLRILYLMAFIDPVNQILGDSFLRSGIQFTILYFSAAITCLLVCCAYQDMLQRLRLERNEDPLTGLLNRRALDDQLETLRNNPVSLNAIMICDLDFFKKINDQYGHYVGDAALKHVSNILKGNVRAKKSSYAYDTISRIGGEEFMIILQDTKKESAMEIAERIRLNIEKSPLIFDDMEIHLTISIGVSFFYCYTEFDEAMRNADQQLYYAKTSGRNCIKLERI